MIKIVIMDNEPRIMFWGENFSDIVEYLRSKYFSYNANGRYWTGSKTQVKNAIPELQDIDEEIEMPLNIMELLEPKPETKFYRRKLEEDCFKLPPIEGKSPYEKFQTLDIEKCLRQNRVLVGNEMGLGKSYEIITTMNHLVKIDEVDKILVLCPGEATINWRRELLKFNTFNLQKEEIEIASSANREPFKESSRVVISTYDTFRMISDDYYKKLNKGKASKEYRKPTIPLSEWGDKLALIADESHLFKSPQGRRWKILKLYKNSFEYRYPMTGTPAPNGIGELWTQLNLLDESIIDLNYKAFIASVANIGNRFSAEAINYYYPKKVEEFLKKIQPWMIRRFSKDVLNLPELYEKKTYIEMSSYQRELYQELILYELNVIKENNEGELIPTEIRAKFPYLTLALHNPCIIQQNTAIDRLKNPRLFDLLKKWKFTDNSKLDACTDLLETYIKEEGKKVILWTGHPLTAIQLAEYYKKYNPYIIHGQVDTQGMDKNEYRDKLVEDFKKDKKSNLLIASYLVLDKAVTITEVTRNIYFDRDWDLTHWLQSKKRTHRIGQEEEVIVNSLIIEESIEESQDESLDGKTDLNNIVGNSMKMDLDTLRRVFAGKKG